MFKQFTTGVAMVANVERKGKVARITLDGAVITAYEERAKQAAVDPQPMMSPMGPGM